MPIGYGHWKKAYEKIEEIKSKVKQQVKKKMNCIYMDECLDFGKCNSCVHNPISKRSKKHYYEKVI